MDLRPEILNQHSKTGALKIAAWIGSDRQRFQQLIQLFLEDEYRVVQHAAWIISLVADKHPELILGRLERMITKMNEPGLPPAVRRNTVRLLQNIHIPEPLQGLVMESCFGFLSDPKEAIAVRAFSMTVLFNLSKAYPEIEQELKFVIEEGLSQKPTAAYKARAKAVLKKL